MFVRVVGAGLAALVVVATPVVAQDVPKWLTDAKARESRLAEPVDVVSEDGWLRTKVPGGVKHKVVQADDSYSLSIDLEGGTAVSCEVMREPRNMGHLLAQTADFTFEEIRKLNGTVEARALEASDAGTVGPYPYMSIQWLYRADRQGEKRVGGLKQYVANLDNAVVYCAHDDLGYTKTFDTVARAVTANLRTGNAPVPQAHFREVSVVIIDGTRVGVASTTMAKDADGDTKIATISTMLVQRVPGQLLSQDVSDVQWVRPDGSLINAWQMKVDDGEVSEEMKLRLHEGERWKASGTVDGKEIDVVMPAAPSSYIVLAKARRQLMAQADPIGASTEATTWSSLDLTRLLPTRATVLAQAGPDAYAVREEIGGVAIEAVLDKQTGTMASAKMPIGPRTMNIERVYRQGSF
jgi:hypothetical protein